MFRFIWDYLWGRSAGGGDGQEEAHSNALPAVNAQMGIENIIPVPIAKPNWPEPRPPIREHNTNGEFTYMPVVPGTNEPDRQKPRINEHVGLIEPEAVQLPPRKSSHSIYMLQSAFESMPKSPKDAISFRDIKKFITEEYFEGNGVAAARRLVHVKACLLKALADGRIENIAPRGHRGLFRNVRL